MKVEGRAPATLQSVVSGASVLFALARVDYGSAPSYGSCRGWVKATGFASLPHFFSPISPIAPAQRVGSPDAGLPDSSR